MALPACKPLQRLENGFRKRQNPFVGNDTSGMAKPRIRAFLRLLGLCCLNDKTSHRFQGENISDGLLSQIFERREKENEHIGIVKCLEICRAFPAHWHNKICCAFNHICKTHVETTHLSRIVYHLQDYTQYRVIQQVSTKGIVETQLQYNDIFVQDYTLPCRHAVEKLYTYIPMHSYMLYPYTDVLDITLYRYTCYTPIPIYLV